MEKSILGKNFNFDDIRYTKQEDYTVILLFTAYKPCIDAPHGKINISNYYGVSQKGHERATEVIEYLTSKGYTAEFYKEHNIKALASHTGGYLGKNTLYIHEEFGSYTNIQAIKTNLDLANAEILESKPCSMCNNCIKVCKTGALSKEGFNAEKCLRKQITRPLIDGDVKPMLYQIMGCEQCQNVCPHNDVEYKKGICLDIIETLTLKNFDIILETLGKNYAKKVNIINQTIIYAANSCYVGAYDVVAQLAEVEEHMEVCEYYFGCVGKA